METEGIYIRTACAFLLVRGRVWAGFGAAKRQHFVEHAAAFWRAHGFPYYILTERQVKQEFSRLIEKDWKKVFSCDGLRSSNTGLRLANTFQRSMWKAKVNRYLSPMEVFSDDHLLRKAIERSLKLWPDRFGANASCLRRMLKTFPGAASVSNYRPLVAKAVIARYTEPKGLVVDFSAGYGGRLLAALALGRPYTGIEPNAEHVAGFRHMTSALRELRFALPKVRLLNGPAERKLKTLDGKSADLVFSSPPFFDWEHYSMSPNQSFMRYPNFGLWCQGFLNPVIAESYRILKKGGRLALNVTNGNRLPSPDHVRRFALEAGFSLMSVHRMVYPKVPYLHPHDGKPVKSELLLVFRK